MLAQFCPVEPSNVGIAVFFGLFILSKWQNCIYRSHEHCVYLKKKKEAKFQIAVCELELANWTTTSEPLTITKTRCWQISIMKSYHIYKSQVAVRCIPSIINSNMRNGLGLKCIGHRTKYRRYYLFCFLFCSFEIDGVIFQQSCKLQKRFSFASHIHIYKHWLCYMLAMAKLSMAWNEMRFFKLTCSTRKIQ